MKRICVYCGSSMGTQEIYREAAKNFGKKLAENNIELVYG
ncbi:MAG: TIGR00730 family Rossman fold protein, partial [Ignavibacteria bacterium]|nr:TIGR00730 family Rossman fold protein [Ignavibacteria bacterium]